MLSIERSFRARRSICRSEELSVSAPRGQLLGRTMTALGQLLPLFLWLLWPKWAFPAWGLSRVSDLVDDPGRFEVAPPRHRLSRGLQVQSLLQLGSEKDDDDDDDEKKGKGDDESKKEDKEEGAKGGEKKAKEEKKEEHEEEAGKIIHPATHFPRLLKRAWKDTVSGVG